MGCDMNTSEYVPESSVKPMLIHDTSIGYGRSVISASAGKFANFLIEVDSTDYKAKTEALKACSECDTSVHPGDW